MTVKQIVPYLSWPTFLCWTDCTV